MRNDLTTIQGLKVEFPMVRLRKGELDAFRGTIGQWACLFGYSKSKMATQSEYFHNHDHSRPNAPNHRRYSLVNYRMFKGNPGFIAWGDAKEAAEQLVDSLPATCMINRRKQQLKPNKVSHLSYECGATDQFYLYGLRSWLALNRDNFTEWEQKPFLEDRTQVLNTALTGHLIAAIDGLGIERDRNLHARVCQLHKGQWVERLGNHLMSFDLSFWCNLILPEGFALGQSISYGYGSTFRMKARHPLSLVRPGLAPQSLSSGNFSKTG